MRRPILPLILVLAASATASASAPRPVRIEVDGRPLAMRALVRDGRVYVPLRAVAQTLGARVAYDARRHLVLIVAPSPPASRAAAGVHVTEVSPPDGTTVSSAFPTIRARLAGIPTGATVTFTLVVDGTDVSRDAALSGDQILYIPPQPLAAGSHLVVLSGVAGTLPFARLWRFTITPEAAARAATTASNLTVTPSLFVDGPYAYRPGSWVHVVLTAPPGLSPVLESCIPGIEAPFWYDGGATYETSFYLPPDALAGPCFLQARVPGAPPGWFTAPPLVLTILATPAPTPVSATPAPRPEPTRGTGPILRHPAPTPSSTPPPRRAPIARPQPHATPLLRATPSPHASTATASRTSIVPS